MNILPSTEPQPIMQYVWDLQQKVREYRAMHRRFKVLSFGVGLAAGALAAGLLLHFAK